MNLDKKIIAEIAKFNKVNKYIMEQDAAAVPAVPEDPAALPDVPAPPEDPAATPPVDAPAEKIDVATDPDVEKIDDKGDSEEGDGTEELDITDLVKSQSNIETKQDDYFENLFGQLSNLESKLSEMDSIMSRLNSIESKIEKYRTKKGTLDFPKGVDLGTGKVGSVDQFTPIASKFGLQVTSAYRSGDPGYHGKNRARDYQTIGAPGNSGTQSQMKFAQNLIQNYGSSLEQLIYTPLGFGIAKGKKVGLDYWGASTNAIHYDHVHVAYAKGGRVTKPTRALIGEKGPEFIFDADTTRGLDHMAPLLLEKLNAAKTKPQLARILQSYAPYESGAEQTVIVMNNPQMIPIPILTGNSGSIGGMSRSSSIDTTYDTQYANA